MFNLFRSKPKAETLMDQFIHAMFGPNPPKKSADPSAAADLAGGLLGGIVPSDQLARLANDLYAGPIPYSTHDLAVSVALRLFKDVPPEHREKLFDAQLAARLTVLEWAKAGKVVRPLLQAFEETLYKLYAP
jgi:hypothetical protein